MVETNLSELLVDDSEVLASKQTIKPFNETAFRNNY